MSISQDELAELWLRLGDVPVTDDCIEQDFHLWDEGTSIFEIWRWFDERFTDGISNQLT